MRTKWHRNEEHSCLRTNGEGGVGDLVMVVLVINVLA